MANVSIRDLRNKDGEVIDRAARGETITITNAGEPVAELHAIPPRGLPADVLLSRWRHLPALNPVSARADIDVLLDAAL